MNLKDLKTGTTFEGIDVLVVKRSDATTKGGKPYLNLVVRDKTAELSAKLWNDSIKAAEFFKEGQTVMIWGATEEYNGNPQLNIKDAAPSHADISQFAKQTEFKVDELWDYLVNTTATLTEPLTKFVLEEILLKQPSIIEAVKKAPAAKTVHNAWFGGLLEHIVSLVQIAEPTIKHYREKYKAPISRDKVLFGLIMHDLGKIAEYDYTNPAFSFQPNGILVNHLVLGPAWVWEAAGRFPNRGADFGKGTDFKQERAHLMHVLAAHHGKEEWGSPVKPASLEAVLVHHLDNLDSKVMHALELVRGKEGQVKGFSERSYFEQTAFLRPVV